MWSTFPAFGSILLLCVMVVASYTFSVSLAAGANGRARTLQAARFGAYGTVALIAVAVICLAYAFVSHDFRIKYVSHYSDRSMSVAYLLTALWGGQDGSLLWWLFLLSLYIGACVKWLGKRYLELQPYVIATLMAVVLFFCILMAFAANPFSTNVTGGRADGEGLNPLLQNFYMIIHPPSLYTGFVGCTIPFAFAVAALVTGRLDHEWIVASRKWTLFAWLFLGIGNALGMLWAYEELGWGGYWAWDPVENAAFMPFLSASAYVHSVMIQERRGMLKVWNVFLICLTFLMTIFGTFLTRSGAIASVHSFAQSSIGSYFVWFIVIAFIFGATLIFIRWPELRDITPTRQLRIAAVITGWLIILACGPGIFALWRLPLPTMIRGVMIAVMVAAAVYCGLEIVFRRLTRGVPTRSNRPHFESVLSREFTFLLNNWGLLGLMLFILVATTFPMITEALSGEKVSVGPRYYNAWVQPIGLSIFTLMGIGTLFGWKKTSPDALKRAFMVPIGVMLLAVVLHVALGQKLGFPAVVWSDAIYGGAMGTALRAFNAYSPVLGVACVAFNVAVLVQEFVLLFRARIRSGAIKATPSWLFWAGGLPGFVHTIFTLPPASRRRYGGYVVHFGIILMLLGFTGQSWNVDREATLTQGQSFDVVQDVAMWGKVDHQTRYTIQYVEPRMDVDNAKRMVFAEVDVFRNGKRLGRMEPARFIYKKQPDQGTTEVAQMHTIRDDLYLVVGTINPQTKMASLQIHVNPLVSWIWLGVLILIGGSIVCMWPQFEPSESRVWSFARSTAAVAASVFFGIMLAATPAAAQQTPQSMDLGGTVIILNEHERGLFSKMRCMCGDCPRDTLETCPCNVPGTGAEDQREYVRKQIAQGMTDDAILADYKKRFGDDAVNIPPNSGAMRAIYVLPLAAIVAGGVGLAVVMRRWRRDRATAAEQKPATLAPAKAEDAYDRRIDEELKDLDG